MRAAWTEFTKELNWEKLLGTVMLALLFFLCWSLIRKALKRCFDYLEKKGRAARDPDTILKTFKYILLLIFGAQLLKLFGVDITSVMAGLGIAGVVAGFAVQDVLKDVTMGANILADHYYSVGDIVRIGNVANGRVVSFNIKATKLEDLDTGNLITMANRNISEATVLSDWQMLDVPAPYEEKSSRMQAVCAKLCRRIEESEMVSRCVPAGTQELGDSAVYYRLRISGEKDKKTAIRRYALQCVQEVYEEEGISVPYPHRVLVDR